MLSISRSAEVPFLNIISYLIQFVKFRSICMFQRTRGVCSIYAEGQRELICEALEESLSPRTSAYDSRSVIRSAGPDRGFGIQGNQLHIVAFKRKICIYRSDREIRSGSPATGPLNSPLLLYHSPPHLSIGKINKNYAIFLVKPHKTGQKQQKMGDFSPILSFFRLAMAGKGHTVAIFTNFEGDFSFRIHNFDQIHTRSRNFFIHVMKTFHCIGDLFNQ